MQELSKAQRGRIAIRMFQTIADAAAIRGFYRPSGKTGQMLAHSLKMLSPEIYGSMNDARIIELRGLEYVLDRLPKGIEECTRIILTAQEELENTSFERIEPPKRRRTSYQVSDKDLTFVITNGVSEIYDIVTHLTFLNIEAEKIRRQIHTEGGRETREWKKLEETVLSRQELSGRESDQALWNLSIILGRTYQEVRQTYQYLEKQRQENDSNHGLFRIIYGLGKRVEHEEASKDDVLVVYFTPSLTDMLGQQRYGRQWANNIKRRLCELELEKRPVHIISANLHSVVNVLYGYALLESDSTQDIYDFFLMLREQTQEIKKYAKDHGYSELPDLSDSHIDCQIIDTAAIESLAFHPQLRINTEKIRQEKPVILVMDYAFGAQAFEVMDELLNPLQMGDKSIRFDIRSISVMGKAGILPGRKGDIMLATAHVFEGTPHNYIVDNDLKSEDFDGSVDVYEGPIVTVLGTSLQNRDVLKRFQTTSWKAIGLEMEGGHYQRAISAAIIRGHICDVKVRYAYYASDNPLLSGQTLASGSMGKEGVRPTYMITKIILEKILN